MPASFWGAGFFVPQHSSFLDTKKIPTWQMLVSCPAMAGRLRRGNKETHLLELRAKPKA